MNKRFLLTVSCVIGLWALAASAGESKAKPVPSAASRPPGAAKSKQASVGTANPLRIIKLTSVYKNYPKKETWIELSLPYGIIIDEVDRAARNERPKFYLFCRDERRIVATEDFSVFMKELDRIKPKSEVDFVDRCSYPFMKLYDTKVGEEYARILKALERKHVRIVGDFDDDKRHAIMCFCESRFEILDSCE